MPTLPINYSKLVTNLCTTNNFDKMLVLGRELLHNLRQLLLKKQEKFLMNQIDKKKGFFNNYISMKAYINKIMSACHKRDILAVSYAATELQIWIAEELAQSEGNLIVNVDTFNFFEEIKTFYHHLMLPNLMEGISQGDFQKIEKTAKKLDFQLSNFCKSRNSKILRLNNLGEVKKYLNNR